MTLPVLVIHLLGGIIFSLSGFVIVKHFRRWRQKKRGLLPLHVWVISVSYNLLVLSMMARVPRADLAFAFGCSGLLLGIYSLWILARFQIKSSREGGSSDSNSVGRTG